MFIKLQKIGSQSEIYQLAKEKGAKWVVILNDHYHGNSKGCYYSVEDFHSAKINWMAEERPITSVMLTDDDVPALVKKRALLIQEFYNIQKSGLPADYVNNRLNEIRNQLSGLRYSSKLYRATF